MGWTLHPKGLGWTLHPKFGLGVENDDAIHSTVFKKVWYANNEAFWGEQERLLSRSKNDFGEQE